MVTFMSCFGKMNLQTKKLTGHALANLTYMFKTSQIRCFDLFDKPNSQYMLAQRLASNHANNRN